jgi:ribonuclease Z
MRKDSEMIDLLLLGTGGMMPLPDRWLSSLLVRTGGHLTLFDCGEGTQISWRQFGWGFRRLSTIFLTHFHADHVAGLPGVLFSVAHAGRTEPVTIVGPAGLREIVESLTVIAPNLGYPIELVEVSGDEQFVLPSGLMASTKWGDHRMPCLSYRLDLHREPRFNVELAQERDIPVSHWKTLQQGSGLTLRGVTFEPGEFLGPPRPGLSFGLITDTRPVPGMSDFVGGVDLLVCEGIYGSDDLLPKAIDKRHMVFSEAATIASDANAKALWLTHFSPAMLAPEEFLPVATAIFPDSTIGYSGLTTTLSFEDSESTDEISSSEATERDPVSTGRTH